MFTVYVRFENVSMSLMIGLGPTETKRTRSADNSQLSWNLDFAPNIFSLKTLDFVPFSDPMKSVIFNILRAKEKN